MATTLPRQFAFQNLSITINAGNIQKVVCFYVADNLPTETMNSLRNKLHFTVSHDKPLTSTSAGYKEAKQIFSAADTRVEGKSVVIDK